MPNLFHSLRPTSTSPSDSLGATETSISIGSHGWIYLGCTEHSTLASLLKENLVFQIFYCIFVFFLGFSSKLKTSHDFLSFLFVAFLWIWRPRELDSCGLRIRESSFSREGLAVSASGPLIYRSASSSVDFFSPRWQPKAPVVEEDWGFFRTNLGLFG